jgi:hypothetical protein
VRPTSLCSTSCSSRACVACVAPDTSGPVSGRIRVEFPGRAPIFLVLRGPSLGRNTHTAVANGSLKDTKLTQSLKEKFTHLKQPGICYINFSKSQPTSRAGQMHVSGLWLRRTIPGPSPDRVPDWGTWVCYLCLAVAASPCPEVNLASPSELPPGGQHRLAGNDEQ